MLLAKKISVVIDHDAGTNPDDILAFLFLLHADNVDIKMTISGNGYPTERARYAYQFFNQTGRSNIPCFAGEATGHIHFYAQDDIEHVSYTPPTDYVSALKTLCDEEDHVVYVAIQGLSNLQTFLTHCPQAAPKLSVFHMGLTLKNAENSFITGGTNIEADPLAAKQIYQWTDLDLKVVGSHTTIHDELRITPITDIYQKIKNSFLPHYQMVYRTILDFEKRRGIWPALHDPLTASAAIDAGFVTFDTAHIDFATDGSYMIGTQTKINISKLANYADFMVYFASLL